MGDRCYLKLYGICLHWERSMYMDLCYHGTGEQHLSTGLSSTAKNKLALQLSNSNMKLIQAIYYCSTSSLLEKMKLPENSMIK